MSRNKLWFEAANHNYICHIGWDEACVIDLEPDKMTRCLKEAIWIRSGGRNTMNKVKGAYKLDKIYQSAIFRCEDVISSTKNCRFLETPHHQSEWTRFLIGIKIYLVSTTLIWICILELFYILIRSLTCIQNGTCTLCHCSALRTQCTEIFRHSSALQLNASATKIWSLNILPIVWAK